jgi:hypothetical protein
MYPMSLTMITPRKSMTLPKMLRPPSYLFNSKNVALTDSKQVTGMTINNSKANKPVINMRPILTPLGTSAVVKAETLTENKWCCEPCKTTYTQSSSYYRHLRSKSHQEQISGEKVIKHCDICNQTFDTSANLKRHVQGIKHQRMAGLELTFLFNCEKCDYHTNREQLFRNHQKTLKHTLSKEDFLAHLRQAAINCTTKGDATQEYLVTILKECDEITDIERIGQEGAKLDITFLFKTKSELQGIQVKTLRKDNKSNDSWRISTDSGYALDTLLVGINSDRTRFCLYYYGDFPQTLISFTIGNNSRDRPNLYYTNNLQDFKKVLFQKLRDTTTLKNNCLLPFLNIDAQKEHIMLKNLRNICDIKGLEYKRHNTSDSTIDCYINGYRIQCKYTNVQSRWAGTLHLMKSKGRINGKRTKVAYEENDFDFLIAQIDGLDYYYVIPMKVLIEKKQITANAGPGQICLTLTKASHPTRKDWTQEFIDRFDLLTKSL